MPLCWQLSLCPNSEGTPHPGKNLNSEGSRAGENYSSWLGCMCSSAGKKEQREHPAETGSERGREDGLNNFFGLQSHLDWLNLADKLLSKATTSLLFLISSN